MFSHKILEINKLDPEVAGDSDEWKDGWMGDLLSTIVQ